MSAPALGRSTAWLVDTWARRTPDRPFLVWAPFEEPGRTWTRLEFARDVDVVAAGLHAAGTAPGDRVALVLPNHPSFLVAWTAATTLGAVAVCLDPRLSRDELAYALGHSAARLVVTTPERADDVALAAPGVRVVTDLDELRRTRAAAYPRGATWSDPASIQYTSGTTARPKAVVWTQANCLWAGQVGAAHQGLGPADVDLVHLPLFHTNALSYSFLSSLCAGGTVVLQPRFSARRFWPAAVEHGVTWTSVVSFCVRALEGADVPSDHRFRGWASSAVVAAPVPVIGWFGMTETVSHPVVSELGHPGVPGSMGRAAPEYAVRVVDDDGRAVPPGEVGELRVRGIRGVSLFSEYLDDAERTAAAYDEHGWFRTGDRVRCEADGSFFFVERDQDLLKVGGENVGALEVERVLLTVPGVREVAVVGRPDPMLGEVPVAFVLAQPGGSVSVADAVARCAELLTPPKRPREIRVVDALPRSTLEKVAKAELRALLAAESAEGSG